MATYEGQGSVAPSPVVVRLAPHDIKVIWQEAVKRAAKRRYDSGSTYWKKGLSGSRFVSVLNREVSRDVFPILAGMIGEWAAYSVLHKAACATGGIDTVLNETGDKGVDLRLAGLTIQVKCRTSPSPLMVRKRQGGRLIPLRSQVYVFCEWQCGETVSVLGQASRKDVMGWRETVGKGWQHLNYTGADTDLYPINRLNDALRASKELEVI